MPEGVCSGDGSLIKYYVWEESRMVENCLNQSQMSRPDLILDDKKLWYGASSSSESHSRVIKATGGIYANP